ncbi:MAG: putative short-subunit dehydrogenase-like oxidoreductase (DUF2520 family) [Spirosomataceae bacterium]|jgi:predicted short-subunit dehydrogenase-like oxidoreductase (DUF2520 family)
MITIIGAGNVAWHLAKNFEANSLFVNAVYSRKIADAKTVTDELYHAEPTNSLDFSESESELFVLAVSDDAMNKVASKLILPPGSTVVHTSGSPSLDLLKAIFEDRPDIGCGVFYPLMTFTKYKEIDFSVVPICVESSDESTLNFLREIAERVSGEVNVITSEQRKILHLAAVFACNFTNHLLAISQEITEANKLDYSLLKPLISETLGKALIAEHPAHVQTGPAIRNDLETLKKHEKMLEDDTDLRNLYRKLSRSIQTFFT